MAYKPEDWLGPLIEEDVQATITWYRNTIDFPKLKKDPDSRFEDDGSNLRSEIELPPLSEKSTVQIVRVFSTEDPQLLLSDGFTCIKARLSSSALERLESEIEDPIDLDMKGDVFTIRGCTIVSTPYGPPEGQVQMLVDELDYHYHLRKIAKNAVFAGDRPRISQMMSELHQLRHIESVRELPAESNQPEHGSSDRFETQAGNALLQSPQSQASVVMASSSPVAASQQPQTQVLVRRKNPAPPRFDHDGVQMASGVNLDRPTAAIPSRSASNLLPEGPSRPATISDTSANLLNVLGKRKAGEDSSVSTTRTNAGPVHPEADATVGSAVINVEDTSMNSAASQLSSRPARDLMAAKDKELPVEAGRASQKPVDKPYWRRRIPKAQKRLLESPASWFPSLPGRQFPHPNVPMEILNQWNAQAQSKPESMILSQSTPKKSQALGPPGSRSAEQAVAEGSGSSSEDESENDEEIPWSSSPARPAANSAAAKSGAYQTQPGRRDEDNASNRTSPMSSSPPELLTPERGSASRPSTAGGRPDLPPDSSWENAVAPRALGQKPVAARRPSPPRQLRKHQASPDDFRGASSPHQDLSSRASAGRVRSQQQRQQQSQQPSPKGLFAPPERFPDRSSPRSGFRLTTGSLQYRPPRMTSGAPRETSGNYNTAEHPPPSTNGTSQTPRGTPAENSAQDQSRRISQSSAHSDAHQQAPVSTAQTVIKGTQIGRRDSSDAMDINRLPSRDPALDHHQRRSEHFKAAQRRQW